MRSERISSQSASPRLFSAEDDWPENLVLSLTPAGRVQLLAPEGASQAVSALVSAFSHSTVDGLLRLVAEHSEGLLPPALLFWRSLGQRYFHTASQLGEEVASRWKSIVPPSAADFQSLIDAAPPMRGLEYLTPQLLARLWDELHAEVVAQAKKHPQGPVEYLRAISPNWRLLGRVTFHLAENKRDENRPFAFLATYAHRLAAGARLQHLPLGQALKEYAGAKDQASWHCWTKQTWAP